MTEHIKTANRLINEKSPYLLQHAYNPIDWFPWCQEAFIKAKTEDKPVFLSIGYSTCHWCHVMARESFEDAEVAEILNKDFISIKVDREERPDLDQVYMNACHAMTGEGGWPLTIVTTPDKKPFFAGTYFPKESQWGRPGIMDVLQQLTKAWQDERRSIDSISEQVTQILQTQAKETTGELGKSTVEEAFREFIERFDDQYGGFGSAPKFPTPHNLLFLLRYWHKTRDGTALKFAEKTLDSMIRGGIFDHIGFGFHRYSTDEKWLVPHFEKMLYDNALMAYVLVEAFEATGNKTYKNFAKKVFTYVMRDMTSPAGGFYTAEDADSEGEEGKFYTWAPEEIIEVLGHEEGQWFCDVFDISGKGNFEGKNIPNLIKSGIVENDRINHCRERLFLARENRIHPHKDDKILTSWNGLMIAALAKGARAFKDEELCVASVRAADFIFSNLINEDGRLLARYRDGHTAFLGYLDDYAFLVWGLLELYETTFDVKYLEQALELNKMMLELFWDKDDGGLFFYGKDGEELIVRSKEIYDGAMPSGNSVAALNLLKLSRITGDIRLSERALKLFSAFANIVLQQPSAHAFLLTALLFFLGVSKEIVIVGDIVEMDTQIFIEKVRSKYMPNTVTILHPSTNESKELEELIPFIKEMEKIDDKTTAYICENYACKAPTTDIDHFERTLQGR